MQSITLNNTPYPAISITSFRAQYALPDSFGVNLFEPKDYTGLGRIDGAGLALNELRLAVVERIPQGLAPILMVMEIPTWQQFFQDQLEAINEHVGLRQPEIEFAAAGFGDALQAWAYALIGARHDSPLPKFTEVYRDWLMNSSRLSAMLYDYAHQGMEWQVQVITNAYGRMGLLVHFDRTTAYAVLDSALACPAEGFMLKLLVEVAAKLSKTPSARP